MARWGGWFGRGDVWGDGRGRRPSRVCFEGCDGCLGGRRPRGRGKKTVGGTWETAGEFEL